MYDVVSGVQAAGSTTFQQTINHNIAIGDTVIVAAGFDQNTGNNIVLSVTDSQLHSYTSQVFEFIAADCGMLLTMTATHAMVKGTDWIKVTYSHTTNNKLVVIKAASGLSSSTADQTNHNNGTSTSPDAIGTGVLNQAHEVVIGAIFSNNSGGQPTNLSSGGAGKTAHSFGTGYLTMFTSTVNSTSATDASGTLPSPADWTCLVMTLKFTASGALAVTSTSPPAGTVGTAFNGGTAWPLASSGGSGAVTWSITKGTLPPGLYFSVNQPGHTMGLTMRRGSAITSEVTKWGNLPSAGGYGIYPPQLTKIYWDELSGYPTFATAALWESNKAHIGAAMAGGYQMILLFNNIAAGTTDPGNWPGGAIMPSSTVMNASFTGMQNTINSIQSACNSLANGSGIAAVCFWNEIDNKMLPFQASYQYKFLYPLMKAAFPSIPIYINFIWFKHGTETSAQFATRIMQMFPGPHPLNPSGWGDGKLYCDGIVTDIYGAGFDNGSLGSRARYWYAEPDMFTPPSGPGLSGSGIPGPCDIADYVGIPWGNIETGNQASGENPTIQTIQNYLVGLAPLPGDISAHSLLATSQQRIASNRPLVGHCWYESLTSSGTGVNNITSSTDARDPFLNQIDAAVSQCNPGNISGTPTQNGSYPITITATDATGAQASANITIVVGAGTLSLSITTPAGSLTDGNSGQNYTPNGVAISAQGGTSPYTFSINTGTLSGSGLTLNANGTITGTCAVVGTVTTFTFTVKATDAVSATAISGTYTITIQPSAVNIVITNPDPLPGGTVGTEYVQNFTLTGGIPPYTISLAPTSPPLPPGLSIDNFDPIMDQAGNPILDQAGGNLS